MGSPWRVSLSNLKYFVVIPPFLMHDSWLFCRAFIHLMNFLLNPYLFKVKVKNWWLTQSKSFWISTVTNILFNFSTSLICKTFSVKRQPSLMKRRPSLKRIDYLKYVTKENFWDVLIKLWKFFLGQHLVEKLASNFELIFYLCLLNWFYNCLSLWNTEFFVTKRV